MRPYLLVARGEFRPESQRDKVSHINCPDIHREQFFQYFIILLNPAHNLVMEAAVVPVVVIVIAVFACVGAELLVGPSVCYFLPAFQTYCMLPFDVLVCHNFINLP